MFLRSLVLGLATSLLLVTNVAAASQPPSDAHPIVVVTNTSHVCQRFDAVGLEHTPKRDKPVPPYLKREAPPGATMVFERLAGARTMVSANPHETKDCTSKLTGHSYRYSSRGPRVKLTFDGTTFHVMERI